MKIEHIALNVADPAEMAQWYCENLGMRVAVATGAAWFVVDDSGKAAFELYCDPADAVPDYASIDRRLLHVAFLSEDVAADRQRLLDAGATPEGQLVELPSGDTTAFVRDPWGLAIQLVRRSQPFM